MCRVERSSDQVVKPLYQEALTKWVGKIPDDVVSDMANIAPMLLELGYDPTANPPAYGTPESETMSSATEPHNEQQQEYDTMNDDGDSKQRVAAEKTKR